MKQLKRRIFTLILSVSLLLLSGMTAFASGEGNIGGGGGMGSGTATDVWHGQDGVRVTVVTADGSVASTPFDLSNANVANNVLNFGKVCKLQYSSDSSLSPNGSYSYSKPGIALPRIISGSSSRASIEAIRRYFCSEYAAQLVSAKSGIPFEELISGSYKLVIEPIAYFTHGGLGYAMTATEAALYNQKSGGTLRSRMPSLTSHFGVCFELEAEESGCGIYINTDINGTYLTTQYKAYLSERPEDGSLDMLFDNSHGDTDFYFDSEKALLQWFRERGGIAADSAQELKDILDSDYVSIHEYVNPY